MSIALAVVKMAYDNELILIGQTYVDDEYGNQKPISIRKSILCDVKAIGRNEFYNAAVADLKPEIVFVIHAYEYEKEKRVEFEGVKYKVIRTYSIGIEEIELTCEKVIADVDS